MPRPRSRSHRRGEVIEKYIDDDQGYLAWLASHPSGYVVNAERTPHAANLFLHRSSCSFITKLSKTASHWTKDFIKICSDAPNELHSWADNEVHGKLKPCGKCKP